MLFYGVWYIFWFVSIWSQNSLVKNKHQFNLHICTNNFDFPKTFVKTQKQGFLSLQDHVEFFFF